jgi:hypothetical protein
MSGPATRYSLTCRRCGHVVLTTSCIEAPELQQLREHAGQCFGPDAPAQGGGAGDILRHVDVAEVQRP